jgi:hypothetical protein
MFPPTALKCAPASTRVASSSPTNTTAGSTAGPSPRRYQDIALQKQGVERAGGTNSITVHPMSTGSMYQVANRRVVSHAVPMVGYLRGAALRSPLDLSFAFASEQTIDELAHTIKMDPLEFRRKNIGDKRWLGVLNAAAEAARWIPRRAAGSFSDAEIVMAAASIGTTMCRSAAVVDVKVSNAPARSSRRACSPRWMWASRSARRG